jgi:hypothetical protein
MLRRILTIISVGLIAGVNADQDKLDQVQKSLDKIMAKAGISISGEFRSQYLSSEVSGGKVDSISTAKKLRNTESNEYTSVDFDIKARPNEYVSARAMFRMHQNWQNFFSDISNPIFSRWISIDGNPMDMFRFSVGDFKERYSPLTLWSPDIDILYEPYIFAKQRQMAMDELFLGDNYRILQGVNLGFDAEVAPIFNEFHFSLIGSRLRSEETNIQNGSMVATLLENTDVMSKYFVGGNLDVTFMKALSVGATYLYLFDHKGSYKGSDTIADTLAQHTSVMSFRPSVDVGKFIGNTDVFQFNVGGEVAFSFDNKTTFTSAIFEDSTTMGTALDAGAKLGITPNNNFGIKLNGSFISNDKDFRNELAQTPSFISASTNRAYKYSRIMNTESDPDTLVSHYSTFDALYNSVFKFVPSAETNRWAKAPFMKNAYYRGIMTQGEFANLEFDPSVQLVMPFGPATPNRSGIDADLKLSVLEGGLEASGLISILKDKTPDSIAGVALPKTSYSQMGVGGKVDIGKLVKIENVLAISGSIVGSSASNGEGANIKKITSEFINFGVHCQVWKRLWANLGIQQINNTATSADLTINENAVTHWSTGLEWKVSDGASLEGSVGQIIVDEKEGQILVDRQGKVVEDTEFNGENDFKQFLVNVFMTVKF